MRQIDNMNSQEIDTFKLKGMLPDGSKAAPAQAQHSPLPWRKAGEDGEVYSGKALVAVVYSKYGGTQDANVELIVRAVNNAQRLADALAEIERDNDEEISDRDELIRCAEIARKALADWEAAQ